MKAIIRNSHAGKRHIYIMAGKVSGETALYYSLCYTVVRRTFSVNADSGNTHPVECERCKRRASKLGITA